MSTGADWKVFSEDSCSFCIYGPASRRLGQGLSFPQRPPKTRSNHGSMAAGFDEFVGLLILRLANRTVTHPCPVRAGDHARRKFRQVERPHQSWQHARMYEKNAGVTQLVECQPSKLNVEGSSPFARFDVS